MSGVKKKFRFTLSTNILIGFVLGILCGIFLGEYSAGLKVFGNAFIKLLQMSILPYIVVSLVAGIGSLTYDKAKVLGVKGGLFLLLFWGIGFAVILLMPLAFPAWETASFFSTSLVEAKKKVDFLELFIPSNPISSMANNVIPATVLFSIAVGIALIGIKDKDSLIHPLFTLSAALTKVTHFVVKLTPIGVFAISASAAGTMTLEEFGRLQVYFMSFIVGALLLTFLFLPMLVTTFTPFKYKDVLGISKDALVTAFATGNLFIVLPVLISSCKDLFERYKLKGKEYASFVDIIIPVSFNFPNVGKLLILLFVLFAAWFYGKPMSAGDYPSFVVSGLFSFFGSVEMAMPFLLDIMELPSDSFQLYLLTAIINGRFATLLAAMHLLIFTLMATSAITGLISIDMKKTLTQTVITVLIAVGVILGTRAFLSVSVENTYTKDKVVAGMHLLQNPLPAVVQKEIPLTIPVSGAKRPRLETIRKQGILRVGYNGNRLPYSYFNEAGDLVGFDIDMAHRLARELGVTLEFIPFELESLAQQLRADHFDIVMSGVPITTTMMEEITFSNSYLDVTMGVVVEDHRREEFASIEGIKQIKDLKIGILAGQPYFVKGLKEVFPHVEVVSFKSISEFFENNTAGADAFMIEAEAGSAWSLLYPGYQAVVPKPGGFTQPLGYPIAGDDEGLVHFINRWLDLKKKDKTIQEIYDYWILGKGATQKEPRWSVIRNVLRWVD